MRQHQSQRRGDNTNQRDKGRSTITHHTLTQPQHSTDRSSHTDSQKADRGSLDHR
ncbi:hypothetical protein D3C72_1564740 [compost metagenome]